MFTPVFTRRRITKAPYLAASKSWPLREVVGLGVFQSVWKNPQISQIHEIKTSPPEIFWRIHKESSNFFPNFIQSLRQSDAKATRPKRPRLQSRWQSPFRWLLWCFPPHPTHRCGGALRDWTRPSPGRNVFSERTGKFRMGENKLSATRSTQNSSRLQLFAGLRPAIEVEIATCNLCVSVKPWNCSETGWEHPQFLTPSVSNATCIVADGTETIDGQTTAERGQHAQCCQCNTIEIAHLEGDKNGLTEALKLDDGLCLVKNGGTYVRKLATVILHFFWEHPFSTTKKISKTMLLLPLFQFWSSSLTTLRLPVLSPYPSGHLDRSLRSSRRRQHKDRNDAALVS